MFETFTAVLFALLVWTVVTNGFRGFKRDDTDSDTERSNLVVFADYKTGVQYLAHPLGGLTPRLDRDGNVMTVEESE